VHALLPDVAIEYPLDLAPVSSVEGNRAAVIFDPTLDLRSSHKESEHVIDALKKGGWNVEALGGAKATSAAVMPLLGKVRLLHYAGHGVFGGREAMESMLPLAAGGHLSLADVLAADAVPSRVVLSGCETARTANDAEAESLGMAQVFVLAGADVVVAPTRPVDDALAARMSKALYGDLADKRAIDAAVALRDARRVLRAASPELDWDAFRVLTR
jgi:CHAT domain-containing protein